MKNLIGYLGLEIETFGFEYEYSEIIKSMHIDDIIDILRRNYTNQMSVDQNIKMMFGECYEIIKNMINISLCKNLNDCVQQLKSVPLNNTYFKDLIKCKIILMLKYIKSQFQKLPIENKKVSFKDYTVDLFGPVRYNLLKVSLGYTDYENADCGDVLDFYQLDDNYEDSYLNIIFRWNMIINNMHQKLFHHIYIETELVSFKQFTDKTFEVKCDQIIMTDNVSHDSVKYFCKKLVFANNLDVIRKYDPVYNEIKPQNFLRIYAKVNKEQSKTFYEKINKQSTLIVNNELQKIIPIRYDDGIFMIAYSDNDNADILSHYHNDTEENHRFFEKYIQDAMSLPENSIKIEKVRIFFWNTGTHYYAPMDYTVYKDRFQFIKRAQLPDIQNTFVIGECVSLNQGWCNGALESVENIFTEILN